MPRHPKFARKHVEFLILGGRIAAIGLVSSTAACAQSVYSDIVGVQRIDLQEGRNFVGIPFAMTAETVEGIFGADQLPAGGGVSSSTIIEEWSQDNQALGGQYFLSNDSFLPGWRTPAWVDASATPMDRNKGFMITIREGMGTVPFYVAGDVPTTPQVQTVSKDGYSIVSSAFPMPVSLADSGLVSSGFTGGPNLVASDLLLFFNKDSGEFDIWVWYDSTTSTWRNLNNSVATQQLQPGEAFVIYRNNRPADMAWVNPVPYTLP